MTRKAKCDECGKTVPSDNLTTGIDFSTRFRDKVSVCRKCEPKVAKRSWAALERSGDPKTPHRPRDMSQLAKHIVDISTGEESDDLDEPTPEQDRASKGGDARAAKLTPEERSAIAKKAARARWGVDGDGDTHAG